MERKKREALSLCGSHYHFEVWGAVVAAHFFLRALGKFPILFLGEQVWVMCSWSHSFSLTLFEVSHCYQLIPAEMPGSSKTRKL